MSDTWETALCPWLIESYERLERAHTQGLLGHAWLFAGPDGIGKRNLACVLARRLLRGEQSAPAELGADVARALLRAGYEEEDHHPDLHYLAPAADKRTISIEQVRETISALELTSHAGTAKALIVEPAERMTAAAANGLLKTLEEPTARTYFLLVSHQPGLLPATVRSRCQVVSFAPPDTRVALHWLRRAAEDEHSEGLAAVLSLCGGAPLRALDLIENDYSNFNKELEDIFKNISNNEVDPQAVADQWLKGDPEVFLGWLATRLDWAIKGRLAPEAWTPVTDLGGDALHNSWGDLTLKTLFERREETRDLLARLGGGVNVDLALRVLLLGFQPGRG